MLWQFNGLCESVRTGVELGSQSKNWNTEEWSESNSGLWCGGKDGDLRGTLAA